MKSRTGSLGGLALGLMLAGTCVSTALADVSVTKVQQRYPWNGLVDITVQFTSGDQRLPLSLSAMKADGETLSVSTLKYVDGTAFENGVSVPRDVANDTFQLIWDAAADVPAGTVATNALLFAAVAASTDDKEEYMIVDLSGGSSALNYPVTYRTGVPEDGWTTEHKTTKLVLRKIKAGKFMAGQATDYPNKEAPNTVHQVTLTKDYWMSVFYLTRRQWYQLYGFHHAEASRTEGYSDVTPRYNISYLEARGNNDPSGAPSADSLFGRLSARVAGYRFDYPTEAQWEYAYRAGTTTLFPDGTEDGRTLDDKGAYRKQKEVGAIGAPNAWGIYVVPGVDYELVRDNWQPSEEIGTAAQIDPLYVTPGSSSSSSHTLRTHGGMTLESDRRVESGDDYDGHTARIRVVCEAE